jgi:uncharacterized membrane protein
MPIILYSIYKLLLRKEKYKMTSKKTLRLVFAALMAAMSCVATMIIQVPSPTGGYIHLGDGFVLLSGILLGPIYGGLAAGIGSMLADILSGYIAWAPATLVIKALAAVVGSLIYYVVYNTLLQKKHQYIAVISAGIGGGIVVTLGYLLFEALLMGNGFAATVVGVPGNIAQNIFGIIISTALMPFLYKIPMIKEMIIKK